MSNIFNKLINNKFFNKKIYLVLQAVSLFLFLFLLNPFSSSSSKPVADNLLVSVSTTPEVEVELVSPPLEPQLMELIKEDKEELTNKVTSSDIDLVLERLESNSAQNLKNFEQIVSILNELKKPVQCECDVKTKTEVFKDKDVVKPLVPPPLVPPKPKVVKNRIENSNITQKIAITKASQFVLNTIYVDQAWITDTHLNKTIVVQVGDSINGMKIKKINPKTRQVTTSRGTIR